MKIATFRWQGARHVGLVSADGNSVEPFVLDAAQAERGALPMIEAQAAGKALPAGSGRRLALADVALEAPIPRPRRNIFCVGRNYHEHAKELADSVFKPNKGDVASYPIVFSKVPECVIAPGDAIELPGAAVSEQIDYEAEILVVIGRGGKNIASSRALEHVWGYTIVNDVTARDVQMRHQQWHLGKSFDTFCPMGPWLVDAAECDATATRIRCHVNGELRQQAHTRDLIFDIPTLIETISRGITLYPGDLIATGTPAGVGLGFDPPRFLRAGDTVRIEVDGIGTLENPVR